MWTNASQSLLLNPYGKGKEVWTQLCVYTVWLWIWD